MKIMRGTSLLLRTLICSRAGRGRGAVAPLPTRTRTRTRFDHLVSWEVDALVMQLQLGESTSAGSTTSASFLVDALSAAAAAQKMAVQCVADDDHFGRGSCCGDRDRDHDRRRTIIDEYLEDSAQLLDACQDLSATLEVIRTYAHSLRLPSTSTSTSTSAALSRASQNFDSCHQAMTHALIRVTQKKQKQLLVLHRCRRPPPAGGDQLGDILAASSALALTACHMVGMSLKSKGGRGRGWFPQALVVQSSLPTSSWCTSLHQLHKVLNEEMKKRRGRNVMLTELRDTILGAQQLTAKIKKHQIQNDHHDHFYYLEEEKELKRRCEVLEDGIRRLDEKVDDLYRNLISLRMLLLGILSRPSY